MTARAAARRNVGDVSQVACSVETFARRLPIEWAEDICPQLSANWLIKNLLPRQGLALVFGHPGTGKSFFALDIALNVALGRPWFGRKTRQGPVIYVAAEGQAGIRNRIAAFKQFHGVESIPLGLVPTSVDLFDSAADLHALREAIRSATDHYASKPTLLVIDTISKTLGGGRENTDDLATYVGNCARIGSDSDCCLLLVHHRPKNSEGTDPRGHGSLLAGVDMAAVVKGQSGTRLVELTKQKDGEMDAVIAFRLLGIPLGEDEDGEAVTSCVVVPAAPDSGHTPIPEKKPRDGMSAQSRFILQCLLETLENAQPWIHHDIPADVLDRTVVEKAVTLMRLRGAVVARTSPDTKPDTVRKAVDRAIKNLKDREIIGAWGKWLWLNPEPPHA